MAILQSKQSNWYDKYPRRGHQNSNQNNSQQQSYQQQGRNRFSINAQFGPNPPFSPYSVKRQAQFLNCWGYGMPRFPYNNQAPYDNKPQQYIPENRQIAAPRPPLQIMSENTNERLSPGNYQNQNQNRGGFQS